MIGPILLAVMALATIALGCAVRGARKRQRAVDKREEQRLVGVPERRRIDRRPDASGRPQVPRHGDGGRP